MTRHVLAVACVLVVLFLSLPSLSPALEMEKLNVQRKEVFEFTEKPQVTREGDKVTITFTSKAFCDATVAVEDANGKIVRHLASGVLGKNAPLPFQKDSLKQTVIWDGKDEIGRYVDDKGSHAVRVSLGLKAQMERTLFWSPKKTATFYTGPQMRAAPEGVYVFFPPGPEFFGTCCACCGPSQLRLFDHEGRYVRTVYPFSKEAVDKVQGLNWLEFPPDGEKLPSKLNNHDQDTMFPFAGTFNDVLVEGRRLYLAGGVRLIRLGTDGTSGGRNLLGPRLAIPWDKKLLNKPDGQWTMMPLTEGAAGPAYVPGSFATSPDGQWLYVTEYARCTGTPLAYLPGVARIRLDGEGAPEPFLGSMDEKGSGSDNGHFSMPVSIDCDAKGRLYVADYLNNRVQAFDAEGRYLKTVPVENPACVRVDRLTGDLYVITGTIYNRVLNPYGALVKSPALTHFGPLEDPKPIGVYSRGELPEALGSCLRMAVDSYGSTRRIWIAASEYIRNGVGGHLITRGRKDVWETGNIKIYEERDNRLVLVQSFHKDAAQALVRPRPLNNGRPRDLYVNPATGMLYVGEHSWPGNNLIKSFYQVIRIDPGSGRIKIEEMPMDAEDLGFDWEGRAYVRTFDAITRFDSGDWREIPYDYGEERMVWHGSGGAGEKPYKAISAVPLPASKGCGYHLGGFGVSAVGNAVVSCCGFLGAEKLGLAKADERTGVGVKEIDVHARDVIPYTPPIYPGRCLGGETSLLHIFDIHGKLLKADVVPGINGSIAAQIDRDNNVYVLAASTPYLDGKPYFNGRGCTLIKVVPGKMKGLTPKGLVPLPEAEQPKRPMDTTNPGLWVEGAEWLFGPVGAYGNWGSGGQCHCYVNGRFALDYFGRSFAPEVDRFRVVVLDTNGNVILRIGKYGNVDDGVPLVKPDPALVDKQGAQPLTPRSIGGDEVAIMHCMHLAVHSDRRLFLADIGNQCIRSVKLGYHAEEKVRLKDVPDVKR